MNKFEYEITKHPSSDFKQIVYFCTDKGDCSIDQLPSDQIGILGKVLNERGSLGWQLIQISFGNNGVLAFWKREI